MPKLYLISKSIHTSYNMDEQNEGLYRLRMFRCYFRDN